jgi:hypothetical protein
MHKASLELSRSIPHCRHIAVSAPGFRALISQLLSEINYERTCPRRLHRLRLTLVLPQYREY